MRTLSKITSGIFAIIVLSIIFTGCGKKTTPSPQNSDSGQYTVSTFAGAGISGFADGSGSAAKFAGPAGLAIDAAGNLYVADNRNHRIRKISPAGVVTTFVGNGEAATTPGTGTNASIAYPAYLAIDNSGNLFAVDNNGNLVKITPSGELSIIANNFYALSSLAIDKNNNIYMGVSQLGSVYKVTADGKSSLLAGTGFVSQTPTDGKGPAASFRSPLGIATDASGNIYVGDVGVNNIRKITPAGDVTTIAGGGPGIFQNGNGLNATFRYPGSLLVNAQGNIYVGDGNNNVIRKIAVNGDVTTFAGVPSFQGYTDGPAAAAKFSDPYGIVFNSSGDMFVADFNNNVIRKISKK